MREKHRPERQEITTMRGRPASRGRGPGRPRKNAAPCNQTPPPSRQWTRPNRLCKSSSSYILRSQLHMVLDAVRSHDDAWLFGMSLDETMCPGYFSIIKEPMDLTIITERVEKGTYACKEAFIADFKRMVENCAFYNGLESEIATKGYRLWVFMLDALHTVCLDNDENKEHERSRDRDVSSGAGAARSPATRLHVPDHVRKPRPKGSYQREDERVMVKTRQASRTAARRKSSLRIVQEEVTEDDDVDDEDFVEPTIKRSRRGRPPKATGTRGRRQATSNATSRTRPVVKSSALEALSRATRKALEESADLTYDICRLSGDFEANSDVAGYYPDLNIAGTHSHPSDLLARFASSANDSGGYTIPESPAEISQSDPNGESNGQTEKLTNTMDKSEAHRESVDSYDDGQSSDGDSSEDSNTPSEKVVPETEDTDTTSSDDSHTTTTSSDDSHTTTTSSDDSHSNAASSDDSVTEAFVQVQGQTAIEPATSGTGSTAGFNDQAIDISQESVTGGATQEMARPPNTVPLGTKATNSPFTSSKRQEAYIQTSVSTPPRCRSVPPLHFVPVNNRREMRVPCSPSSSGPDDSDSNATANADAAEEARSSATTENREKRPSIVESGEDVACRATAEPEGESDSRELNNACNSDGQTEAMPESGSGIVCRVVDGHSGSVADSDDTSCGTNTEVSEDTTVISSEKGAGAILEALDIQKTTREQAIASLPAGNVSPGRVQARERWITKLQSDLQGAEQEFYCTLDSPKSSFSFSSGYLSEEALSPSMRYHSSSSPLPQLSPSRLSPLLPTSCQPPQKETPPATEAEVAQPSNGHEAVVDAQPVDKAPGAESASVSESAVADQPRRPEPTVQSPSPPFGVPTPLQKMSALVADLQPPAKTYGEICFPYVFPPPTTSAGAGCGSSGDQRRDGRDGTAFRPTYSIASHSVAGHFTVPGQSHRVDVRHRHAASTSTTTTTAGPRLSSSCIARPVPTQPHLVGAQRTTPVQEPIAYFIPAAPGHLQPIPGQQVGRASGEGGVGAAAIYNWPGGMGVPVPWGFPPVIYYPAELAGHAPQTLFLPDLSPEAQRNALTTAPWLRRQQRTLDYHSQIQQQQQHLLATALFQSPAQASHLTSSGTRGANGVTLTMAPPSSSTLTSSSAEKAKTSAARGAASVTWQQQQQQPRAIATHYQMPQPLMVTSAAQLRHLAEALYRQER